MESFPTDSIYYSQNTSHAPSPLPDLVSSTSEINLTSSPASGDPVPRSQSDIVHHVITAPPTASIVLQPANRTQIQKKKSFWRFRDKSEANAARRGYGSDVDYWSDVDKRVSENDRGNQSVLPPLPFPILPAHSVPVGVSPRQVERPLSKELHPIIGDRSCELFVDRVSNERTTKLVPTAE